LLLQLDVRGEPPFQIIPRADCIVDGGAGFDRLDVALQHLMGQPLLTSEIVIKRALARPGSFQDFVWAGRYNDSC
jgi:hypothetical protein